MLNTVKAERAIKAKWNSLRMDLIDQKYTFDNISKAKNSAFLSEFDKLFMADDGKKYLEISISRVFDENVVVRGTILKADEKYPTCERFIPKANCISNDNRFSPKGVEWLYLALGYPISEKSKENAIQCSIKECRAKRNDLFATCHFQLSGQNAKVIDLTIGDGWTSQKQKAIFGEYINDQLAVGSLNRSEMLSSDVFQRSIVTLYSNLLSKELFVPIKTNDSHMEYVPFHCMAKYFQSYGYNGIIYESTVYGKAKDLVLFDKKLARPIESSIKVFTVS